MHFWTPLAHPCDLWATGFVTFAPFRILLSDVSLSKVMKRIYIEAGISAKANHLKFIYEPTGVHRQT